MSTPLRTGMRTAGTAARPAREAPETDSHGGSAAERQEFGVDTPGVLGTAFAGSIAAPAWPRQQAPQVPPYAPRDWSGQNPLPYPDPDLIALDPRFRRYILFNTPIRRLHIGTMWAEGPAWNGVGQYLSGVTSPTTSSTDGFRTTDGSRCFGAPRVTATATRSTAKDASSPASMAAGGSPGMSRTAMSPSSPTGMTANGSISPNDAVVHPDGGHLVQRSALRHSR